MLILNVNERTTKKKHIPKETAIDVSSCMSQAKNSVFLFIKRRKNREQARKTNMQRLEYNKLLSKDAMSSNNIPRIIHSNIPCKEAVARTNLANRLL